ncbi:hypothetical protein D3C78_1264640 [compost metagenome]
MVSEVSAAFVALAVSVGSLVTSAVLLVALAGVLALLLPPPHALKIITKVKTSASIMNLFFLSISSLPPCINYIDKPDFPGLILSQRQSSSLERNISEQMDKRAESDL